MKKFVKNLGHNIFGYTCLLLGFAFMVFWAFLSVPFSSDFFDKDESVHILDKNGQLLFEILSSSDERYQNITIEKVSQHFLNAIIVTEDSRFFDHGGIDYLAVVRAMKDNFIAGRIVSGASTISSQLARNLLSNANRGWKTKIMEAVYAYKLEKQFSKKEILEMYINRISFGGVFVGVESASVGIFGKSSENLDIAESALLAGIVQSPVKFSPFNNFDLAKKRQEFVLGKMFEGNLITKKEFEDAKNEKLNIVSGRADIKAPHFVFWLMDNYGDELNKKIEQKVVRIFTTLDFGLQEKIEKIIKNHILTVGVYHNITSAAVLVFEVDTGNILVFVGSADFFDDDISGQVNMLDAYRQVGSTLKPFLYLLAFADLGWNGNTHLIDEPSAFMTNMGTYWEPKNYDLQYHGVVTVREALAQSLNISAAKTLSEIGIDKFLGFLNQFGIEISDEGADFGLSAALGTPEMKLISLAHAYGVLAREGGDFDFNVFPDAEIKNYDQVASRDDVLEIIDIMSDNNARIDAFGEDSPLSFDYQVAAKTGTTRDFRDNFTIGFTPEVVVFVWAGNADGSQMREVSGISGAGPIFNKVMNLVMQNRLKREFGVYDKSSDSEVSGSREIENGLRILSPANDSHFQIASDLSLESQKISFQSSEICKWFVNGVNIGEGSEVLWLPKKGSHSVICETSDSKAGVNIFVD